MAAVTGTIAMPLLRAARRYHNGDLAALEEAVARRAECWLRPIGAVLGVSDKTVTKATGSSRLTS